MSCTGSGCPAATWDDFKAHFSICLATWMGLFVFGLVAAVMRHLWDAERVSMYLQPIALLLQESKYYLLIMAILSSLMCFFNLLWAGGDTVFSWAHTLEDVTCYVHAAEVVVLLLFNCAQSQEDILAFAIGRLFSDCFVCVSVLARGKVAASYFSFSFCAALRLRNLWTAFEQTISPLDKGFKVKLFTTIFPLVSRVFVFSALMRSLESFEGEPWLHQTWANWETANSPSEVWTTSSSLYFVLCTLSTVGYGDIQPRSIIGQVMQTFVIVLGIGLVVYTVVQLIEIFQHANSGGGEYRIHSASRMRRHIVVTGTPCAQTLQELLEELYHDDHMALAAAMDCVILLLPGSQHVMDQVRRWLHLKQNRRMLGKVFMLQGSPLHWRDLDRCKMDSACMGLILPNTHAGDLEREDVENGMRALSMHRHTAYVRLVALLTKVEFKDMFVSAGLTSKDIVCVDEMKLGIMGKACEAQGFIPLVCNLFKSAGEFDESGEDLESSTGDYLRGMGNEIYEVRLNACYRHAPFGEVAIDILKRSDSKAYMIGIIDESRYPGEDPIIRMHPGRLFRIGVNDDYVLKGIFIAPDGEVIHQHPPDKPFSWHLDQGASALGAASRQTLPNEVPDDTNPTQRMAERWLPDARVVKRDFEQKTRMMMESAADKRTVQGLKNIANVPRNELEEIMDKKVKDADWVGQDYNALEDTAGDASDPQQKALLLKELSAARTQEKEKAKSQAEVRTRDEARRRMAAQKITVKSEKELEMLEDKHSGNEQKIDESLWGGPQTPRKQQFGNPQEPPTALLIRGEHVVLLALEGDEGHVATGAESNTIEAAGQKLGLQHFMRALRAEVPAYAQRPVVVLSQRVPYDWPKVVAEFKDVYLITGRPLAEENLEQSGILHAKAVLIYQRGAVTTSDPTLVDAQAIFATVLSQSLLAKASKELLCIVDLNLHNNSYFVAAEDEADKTVNADEMSLKKQREILFKERTEYINTKRYMSGQLFTSGQAITSLVANMLYNPALGSLVNEMLSCRFAIVPIPVEFRGDTFQELYSHTLRKRNLVVVALLRRFDEKSDDELIEMQDGEAPMAPVERYDPAKEVPGDRFIYTMPEGCRRISQADAVVCLVPKGDAVFFVD